MHKRLVIPLKIDEYTRLSKLAERELRLPEQEARHLLREALNERVPQVPRGIEGREEPQ